MKALPNVLTLLNLSCGFLAIAFSDLFWSPILILLAGLFDLFDGAAARWLKAESPMGLQLDSLCDLVSFGVAPAILLWLLVPNETVWFLLVPLIYVLAGAWRLARFNVSEKSSDFTGLAIPAAALFICGITLGFHWDQAQIALLLDKPIFYALLGLIPATLMISHIPMFSLKSQNRKSMPWIIALAVGTVIIATIDYRLALVAAITLYVVLSVLKLFFDRN